MARRWGQPDWAEYARALDGAFEWGEPPLPRQAWMRAYRAGCCHFAVLENARAVAVAGIWPRSRDEWEITGVATALWARRRGYARAVVSAAADEILRAGRVATLTTRADNTPMIRAARAVGFSVRETISR